MLSLNKSVTCALDNSKYIHCKYSHVNMKNIRENIKMMSVNQISVYHTLLEAYNIMRYSSSEQIHTKWTDISEKKYSLRSITNNDLKVPEKPRLKCMGFTCNGIKVVQHATTSNEGNPIPRYLQKYVKRLDMEKHPFILITFFIAVL